MERAALANLSDGLRTQTSARLYISYMNQNVLQPLGIRPNGAAGAQCMPLPRGTRDIGGARRESDERIRRAPYRLPHGVSPYPWTAYKT
jgi:hypothetical protein